MEQLGNLHGPTGHTHVAMCPSVTSQTLAKRAISTCMTIESHSKYLEGQRPASMAPH